MESSTVTAVPDSTIDAHALPLTAVSPGSAAIPRPAARVLLIDARNRILLFHAQLSTGRLWTTPGGGLLSGETHEQAAIRELWEEAGVQVDAVSRCVWTLNFIFHYNGAREAQERYFVARVAELDEISDANRDEDEKQEIIEHRWWTLDDLRQSDALFRPRDLAMLLAPILVGELPDEPLALAF